MDTAELFLIRNIVTAIAPFVSPSTSLGERRHLIGEVIEISGCVIFDALLDFLQHPAELFLGVLADSTTKD
jgi:hypothetical protein